MLIAMQGIKEVRDMVHSTLLRDQKQKSWGGETMRGRVPPMKRLEYFKKKVDGDLIKAGSQ